MNYAAETTAVSVAAKTTTASGNNSILTGDPAEFLRELQTRMSEGLDQVSSTLEKLASSFPGATITTQNLGNFGAVKDHYSGTSAEISINLGQDTLEQMALDEDFSQKVQDMITELLSAGKQQNLVNAGGSQTTRNVSITEGEIRYTEVQRGANGTQMSVSSLLLESQQMIADTLQTLLDAIQNRSSSQSGKASSPFDFLFNSTSQSGSKSGASGAWRFESYISSTTAMQNIAAAKDRLQVQQQTLQMTITQWAQGGAKVDLQTYMEQMGLCDPLVLDLGGEGINLTSAEDGVYFDIKGDGSPVRTAFIQGNNAFLYLDGNDNGVVDDVSELFGDYGGYANGFENLRQYDDNGDGVIDENDAIYKDLKVWRDLNGDGVNQESESMSLADAGVQSINLNYNNDKKLDANGNVIGESSSFTRTDGSKGAIVDAWLRNLG